MKGKVILLGLIGAAAIGTTRLLRASEGTITRATQRSAETLRRLGPGLVDGVDTDLCGYFAGIGELVDLEHMEGEVQVVDVNLLGMIRTVAGVLPGMVRHGRGHFIGVSSLADELL